MADQSDEFAQAVREMGDAIIVVGLSGSGKTVLTHLLAGVGVRCADMDAVFNRIFFTRWFKHVPVERVNGWKQKKSPEPAVRAWASRGMRLALEQMVLACHLGHHDLVVTSEAPTIIDILQGLSWSRPGPYGRRVWLVAIATNLTQHQAHLRARARPDDAKKIASLDKDREEFLSLMSAWAIPILNVRDVTDGLITVGHDPYGRPAIEDPSREGARALLRALADLLPGAVPPAMRPLHGGIDALVDISTLDWPRNERRKEA